MKVQDRRIPDIILPAMYNRSQRVGKHDHPPKLPSTVVSGLQVCLSRHRSSPGLRARMRPGVGLVSSWVACLKLPSGIAIDALRGFVISGVESASALLLQEKFLWRQDTGAS